MRIAVKFAYDGRKFHGYARQPQLKTIEGEIIKILVKNGFIEDTTESCFRSASRTDKGVSALGNVVAFNTDAYKERIFQELKNDLANILVYGIKDVEPDFYPRYAKQRTYRYYLKNEDFKLEKALSAVASFAGEYNFSNFARLEEFKDPVRTIDNIIICEQDDFLIIDFYAQTFLWNQVRRIVSAIHKMAIGKLEKEQIIEALHNPNKKVDFGLAPSEPLILKDIVYDFEFDYGKEFLDSLKDFEKNIVTSF
ncbi:MAG: tRNA pseudouridine(38-40) synthase TruA [Thermoplasmatales archaeon]|nr:MAG: tRNA pseudouridine(38-40) synthase TruA [Thermoplasmatales archaeon]